MITWSEQLQCTCVTAISLISLFFEGFCCELRIYFRSHKPVSKTKIFSFVTLHIYNAFMNEVELPFSLVKVL